METGREALSDVERQMLPRWLDHGGIFPITIATDPVTGKVRKTPLTDHGHLDAVHTIEDVAALAAEHPDRRGWGFRPAGDRFVLDVDVKEGKNGRADLAALEAEHGPLPPVLVWSTPSGGEARLLAADEVVSSSVGHVAAGLDIRGSNGWQAIPPTPKYEIIRQGTAATAPAWLVERARKAVREALAEAAVHQDQDWQIRMARRFLASKLHNEPEGEDEHRFVLACRLRDFGLTEETALEGMSAWNAACDYPRDANEIEKAVTNAYRHAQNAPGAAVAAFDALIDHEAEPEPAAKEPKPALLERVALSSRKPPPHPFLIPGFVPDATLTTLYGDGGAGKTLFLIQMAACIATGHPFLGRPVVQAPAVLYLCEDGRRELQRRGHDVATAIGADPDDIPNLHVLRPRGDMLLYAANYQGQGTFTPTFATLTAYADEVGAKFIGIDNAASVFGANEIDRQPVGDFLRQLLHRAEDENRSYFLLGHPPKNGARSSGSTTWRNVPRAMLWFERDTDESGNRLSTNTISTDKRNLEGLIEDKLTLYFDRGAFTVDQSSPAVQAALADQAARAEHEREVIERGAVILYHKGIYCSHTGSSSLASKLVNNGLGEDLSKEGLNNAIKRGLAEGWLRADVRKPKMTRGASEVFTFPAALTRENTGLVYVDTDTVPTQAEADPKGHHFNVYGVLDG